MAISRLKTWVDTEILYANDLNAEFNNIVDNGLDLISPLTGALDCNGQALQNVAAGSVTSPGLYFSSDANTGLYRSAADTVDLAAGGIRSARFNTVASGVNFLDVTPSATGTPVLLEPEGSDTDISLNLVPKGTGTVQAGGVAVVTLSGTQTLTNKTLTTPTIGSFANATHTHADAAGGGTLGTTALDDGAVTRVKLAAVTVQRAATLTADSYRTTEGLAALNTTGTTTFWATFLVANDYVSGDATVVFLLRVGSTGTAKLTKKVYRTRDAAARSTIDAGSSYDFTPGDTNSNFHTAITIAAANFTTGDTLHVALERDGDHASDTAGEVAIDGVWIEYTGRA